MLTRRFLSRVTQCFSVVRKTSFFADWNCLSTGSYKIEALYQLERRGENERLSATKIGNRRLLFHGTNSANLVSILTQGLLLSAVDTVLRTGAIFGDVRNGVWS